MSFSTTNDSFNAIMEARKSMFESNPPLSEEAIKFSPKEFDLVIRALKLSADGKSGTAKKTFVDLHKRAVENKKTGKMPLSGFNDDEEIIAALDYAAENDDKYGVEYDEIRDKLDSI
jgi:hypothetical protein